MSGGGELGGTHLAPAEAGRQLRAVLCGEGVLKRRLGVHQHSCGQDRSGHREQGGHRQHEGLHTPPADTRADDPAQGSPAGTGAHRATAAVSRTIRPSTSSMVRVAQAPASEVSCVTSTMVCPSPVELGQQVAHLLTGGGVQRSCRLVGQQQARPVHQRTGHGDALPLASGEPSWVGAGVPVDAQVGEQFPGAGAGQCRGHPGQLCR